MLSTLVSHPIHLRQISGLAIPDAGLSQGILADAMGELADRLPKDAIGVVRAEQDGPWDRIVGHDRDGAAFLYADRAPARFATLRRLRIIDESTGKAEETHSPRIKDILSNLIAVRQALNIEARITRSGTTAILLRQRSIVLIDRDDARTGRIMMHPASSGHEVFEEIEFLEKGFDTIFSFGDPS